MLDNVPNKPGTIGTPGARSATRAVLLGAGELGREVAIALIRLGVEVTAIDRYPGAPAMQVAQHSRVIDMLDPDVLHRVLVEIRPDLIVPEIEAIATDVLMDLEKEIGAHVVPTAFAARTTMNREGIRALASEELGLPTSAYRFATTRDEFDEALAAIGLPCFVKPVMSSSGKGQSFLRSGDRIDPAWHRAQTGGRAGRGRVIVEAPVDFDFEITLLTVRHRDGTSFCEPIGHRQEDGDYRESWQPQAMTPLALERAQDIALRVTEALGGWGLFGVELFVRGDDVWFSEVSPRPHDTGMVTLISQNLSEFELHARAILGLPFPEIRLLAPSASVALLGSGDSTDLVFTGIDAALAIPDTDLRLFGKPEIRGTRRLGVALASADSAGEAVEKALRMAATVTIDYR